MRKIIQPIFYLFVLTLMVLLSASQLYAADAATDLTALLNHIKTMKADFNQTIFDNHNKPIQKATGVMALSRPGKFYWEVTQPIPQIIIANNDHLWIYDPDLEQVTIRSLAQAASGTPGLMLSQSNASLSGEFKVKEISKNQPGWRWFQLKPLKSDSNFASIQFGFQADQIEQMNLTDNLGHETQIVFTNIKTNTSLPSSLFVFRPKGKVDTIDETKTTKTAKQSK